MRNSRIASGSSPWPPDTAASWGWQSSVGPISSMCVPVRRGSRPNAPAESHASPNASKSAWRHKCWRALANCYAPNCARTAESSHAVVRDSSPLLLSDESARRHGLDANLAFALQSSQRAGDHVPRLFGDRPRHDAQMGHGMPQPLGKFAGARGRESCAALRPWWP